jgi:hypothetical protein
MEHLKSNENPQSVADTMNRLHNLASEHPDPEKDKIVEKLLEQWEKAQEEGNSDEVIRLIGEIDKLYDGTPGKEEPPAPVDKISENISEPAEYQQTVQEVEKEEEPPEEDDIESLSQSPQSPRQKQKPYEVVREENLIEKMGLGYELTKLACDIVRYYNYDHESADYCVKAAREVLKLQSFGEKIPFKESFKYFRNAKKRNPDGILTTISMVFHRDDRSEELFWKDYLSESVRECTKENAIELLDYAREIKDEGLLTLLLARLSELMENEPFSVVEGGEGFFSKQSIESRFQKIKNGEIVIIRRDDQRCYSDRLTDAEEFFENNPPADNLDKALQAYLYGYWDRNENLKKILKLAKNDSEWKRIAGAAHANEISRGRSYNDPPAERCIILMEHAKKHFVKSGVSEIYCVPKYEEATYHPEPTIFTKLKKFIIE